MKDKFMMIRATEEEKLIATSKARDLNMNLSAFVRFLIRDWDSPEKRQNKNSASFLRNLWNNIKGE